MCISYKFGCCNTLYSKNSGHKNIYLINRRRKGRRGEEEEENKKTTFQFFVDLLKYTLHISRTSIFEISKKIKTHINKPNKAAHTNIIYTPFNFAIIVDVDEMKKKETRKCLVMLTI